MPWKHISPTRLISQPVAPTTHHEEGGVVLAAAAADADDASDDDDEGDDDDRAVGVPVVAHQTTLARLTLGAALLANDLVLPFHPDEHGAKCSESRENEEQHAAKCSELGEDGERAIKSGPGDQRRRPTWAKPDRGRRGNFSLSPPTKRFK